MSNDFDCVIVGGGVIGLACARFFSMKGMYVCLIEKESRIGTQTSSRNSEVIHAGIYYDPLSLKAKLCRKGKTLLYAYCEENSIPYLKCGKWIVSNSNEDNKQIENIHKLAKLNNVDDLYYISIEEAQSIEPFLKGTKVLVSPSSGIFDSHCFMENLKNDLEESGGIVAINTTCNKIKNLNPGFELSLSGPDYKEFKISSSNLINAAGLSANGVASKISNIDKKVIPDVSFAKGTYYKLYGRQPFSRLIYPIPERGGLGIHYTLDLQGSGKFGPDVEWVNEINYSTSSKNKAKFIEKIMEYFPNLNPDELKEDYAGIRPKLGNKKSFMNDFQIQNQDSHGIHGLVNFFGIESPGLTASLAFPSEIEKYISI